MRGISFGNFLIKQIVEDLKAETPTLNIFATLSPVPGFRRWLETDKPEHDADLAPADLERLCAIYLARPNAKEAAGGPIDPVASFHLTNGARLERINSNADLSEKGQSQSLGVMVNYRYLPDEIEANHESFINHGQVAVSGEVRALLSSAKAGRSKKRHLRNVPATLG